MQAWSEEPYLRIGLPGIGRMTNPVAVGRTFDNPRTSAEAGRSGFGVSGVRGRAAVSPGDAELMARVGTGDQHAFAAVYDRYAQTLYGAVMRYLRDPAAAEDVLQETFLTMWTRSEAYSPETGSLVSWLLTIARNRAIDRIRAASRRPMVVGISPASSDGSENDLEGMLAHGQPVGSSATDEEPADFAERRWIRAVVRTAIDGMPEDERRALELAYDDQLTQAEIAARLGWPIGTVKTRTRRALARMREMLEGIPDLRPTTGPETARANEAGTEDGRHGSH
jgi:RNA polymerase sigma-70 factor (ECF subfamily)